MLAREEGGYHQLETLFARIELADSVRVATDTTVRELEVTGADAGPPEQNLAFLAAEAFARETGWPNGFRIEIENRDESITTDIFMNVLCQSYNVFSKFTTNIDPEKGYSGYLLFILIILYFGQGIWLNLVRLLEPSYLPTFCFYTKQKFCSRRARRQAKKA